MTAAANARPQHPRTRPMESWRGAKAVMASRGETSGQRVDECTAALEWWRNRKLLIDEIGLTPEAAESLLDQIDKNAGDPAEAVARS